jgi:polar amino acid transport system ATP-binding protein
MGVFAKKDQDPVGTTRPPLLQLDDICISYGHHTVVHDVSLRVDKGEVVALIGPSGAGKSSLLRSINLLEHPSRGTIQLDGQQIDTATIRRRSKALIELRREVGMVFQQFNLFPHLTALENVVLAQRHALDRPKEDARQRAIEELEHVGLRDHADKRPGQCSGGQQQRIAIARALALDPKVMLFDEPTSALDPELGLDVLNIMRRLAAEGMTMLVVTHEMHFAEDVADRVLFMADGRIVESGPPSQVIRNPLVERTQRFVRAVKDR